MDEQAITFTDKDAERVHHPHDDAIVITLLIADYTTRKEIGRASCRERVLMSV